MKISLYGPPVSLHPFWMKTENSVPKKNETDVFRNEDYQKGRGTLLKEVD